MKEPVITIKPATDKKDKPKKDKGANKEEACRLAVEAAEAAAQLGPDDALGEGGALQRLRELGAPDKVLRRACAAVLERALAAGDASALQAAVRVARAIKRAPGADALRALLAAQPPHARLPRLLAHAVAHKLASLAELGAWCEPPRLHPLLLDVLQELQALAGAERTRALYDESKLNLCAFVSDASGGSGGALEALEARGLAALVPQLRVQAQLARQLAAEPAPHALYRWIKVRHA